MCMIVVLTCTLQAQQPNQVDTGYVNQIISDIDLAGTLCAIKGSNEIITVSSANQLNGSVLINGVSYDGVGLSGDATLSASGTYSIRYAHNNDSIVVLSGGVELYIGQTYNARAKVIGLSSPNHAKLAVSFYNPASSISNLIIKDTYLNDTVLYLLLDGVTASTTTEVVLNNGQPQVGTAMTGDDAALLKIDRSTGAILKQVYFNQNDSDGFLNSTHFNKNSLLQKGNRLYFTSVSSLSENFMLHVYDMNLNLIKDTSIVISPYVFGDRTNHSKDKEMAYGMRNNGKEYLGFIAKTVPVIVDLSTYAITYIDTGSGLNNFKRPVIGAHFVNDAFIFVESSGWIKRIELCNMTSSIIHREWLTNSPTLDGKGSSAAQESVRVTRIAYRATRLVNGKIEYLAGTTVTSKHANGVYINGELVAGGSQSIGDVIIYRGSFDTHYSIPTGYETVFSSPDGTDSVQIVGNNIIYSVDSSKIANTAVNRNTGVKNAFVFPGAFDTVDFSNNKKNIAVTYDLTSTIDVNTICVYVESAIVRPVDTSDISISEITSITAPLYPNPFINSLTIPEVYRNKKYTLSLYDISGKLAFQETNISDRVYVDQLPSGMYITHIQDSNNNIISVQKIVKRQF